MNNLAKIFTFSFILEVLLFAINLILALFIGFRISAQTGFSQIVAQAEPTSALQFVVFFLLATVIILILLRLKKKAIFLKILFYLAIIEGVGLFCQVFFPWPYNYLILAFILAFWLWHKSVIAHNLVIIITTSIIAVVFGLNFLPSTALLVLMLLAVYDFLAVYKTKHMIKMFHSLAQEKILFALIIPVKYQGLAVKIKDVNSNSDFLFLGSGDLALPAMLAVSCLKISLFIALSTAIGALAGFIALYILFNYQKDKKPMPGLPLIVFGSVLGFLIGLLIS